MSESDLRAKLDELECKLARGERRWKRTLAGIGAVVALATLAAASKGDLLFAENILLHDKAGKVRGQLGVQKDGSVGLWLTDTEGKEHAKMVFDNKGNSAMTLSQAGKERAAVVLTADGVPLFSLNDVSGASRVTTMVNPVGQPVIALSGKDGKTRVRIGLRDTDSAPVLSLNDVGGKEREVLIVNPDGSPAFGLIDGDGKYRASVLLKPDGTPQMSLTDKLGKNLPPAK